MSLRAAAVSTVFLLGAVHGCSCSAQASRSPSSSDDPPPPPPPPPPPAPDPCDAKDYVPFSDTLITQLDLKDGEVADLQFYSAYSFAMTRVLTTSQRDTAKHQLVTRNGVTYEEISVDCLTPGRLTLVAKEGGARASMWVSFEKGTPGIQFVPGDGHTRAGVAQRLFLLATNREGKVDFDDNEYELREIGTYLLISRAALESRKDVVRKLKGWTFDDGGAP